MERSLSGLVRLSAGPLSYANQMLYNPQCDTRIRNTKYNLSSGGIYVKLASLFYGV